MSSRSAAARRKRNPSEYSEARPSTRRGTALTPTGHVWIPRTRTSVCLTEARAPVWRTALGQGRIGDSDLRECVARHPRFTLRELLEIELLAVVIVDDVN